MTVVTLPDVEALLSEFLRAQPEVTALVAARVYTAIPKDPTWPLVRLTRIAGTPTLSRPLHLDNPTVQIDAFGGSKKEAHALIETVRSVIAERVEGVHDGHGVVTAYEFGTLSWLPESAAAPARARYVADVSLWVHPHI